MPSYKNSPVLINKAVPQPVGPQPLSMQGRSSFPEAGLGIRPCWTLWGSWWHILPSCPTPSVWHPWHGESTLLPDSVSFANLMKKCCNLFNSCNVFNRYSFDHCPFLNVCIWVCMGNVYFWLALGQFFWLLVWKMVQQSWLSNKAEIDKLYLDIKFMTYFYIWQES